MPAERLPKDNRHRKAESPYSIVGVYAKPFEAQFVRHVAILAEESELRWNRPARVWHMGPPLVAGDRSRQVKGARPLCPVHLVGSVLLDLDDREGIEDWLAEVDTEPPPENPFKRYVVRPHCDWQTAPETGRRLYRRFSCAGFVVECYRSVGINLVNTREADLPDVEYAMIKHAYPQVKDRANVQEAMGGLTLDDLGLGGDGPWQVVLAGYVFHALDEISDENPRAAPHAPASTAEAYYPKPLP